jgi:hypothetical protein
MKFRSPTPAVPPHLTGSLDGPSRTITVEPLETPVPAPPPEVHPERKPERPSKPPQPAAPCADRARAMQSTAPDLIRAVIGFRQWRLHGDELVAARRRSLGRGVQTALRGEHAHEGLRRRTAARAGSTRGTDRPRARRPRHVRAGGRRGRAWGRVELHAHGSAPSTR